MFTIYSKTVKYAIATMVYLYNNNNNNYIKVKYRANECNIPIQYLAKIVQKLRHNEMISSIRGPSGGIKLSKHAASITIEDIISSLDENLMSDNICIMGYGTCHAHPDCALHFIWKDIREKITNGIELSTIQELENYHPENNKMKGER